MKKSKEFILDAMLAYRSGQQRSTEIASRFRVTPGTLTYWAKRMHLPIRKRGCWKRTEPKPHQVKILQLALERGQASAAVASGLSRQRVHSLMKRWSNWVECNLNRPLDYVKTQKPM
jgi:hypothetical protein